MTAFLKINTQRAWRFLNLTYPFWESSTEAGEWTMFCKRRLSRVSTSTSLPSAATSATGQSLYLCFGGVLNNFHHFRESEDTMLMMMREIYNLMGVTPDRQFDRTRENSAIREMPRERSWSAGSKGSKGSASPSNPSFLSPNSYPSAPHMAGPPPTSGFVRK